MAKDVFEVKSPEEIKKGLAYCDSRDNMFKGCAGGCPYWCDKYGCHSTKMKIDALGYIRQLEERIAGLDKLASSRLRSMKLFKRRAERCLLECWQLRNKVKRLETYAPKWNILDERKPEPFKAVVTYSRDGTYAFGFHMGMQFVTSDNKLPDYWYMLPEPPKEG